jgi:hypothetical protein
MTMSQPDDDKIAKNKISKVPAFGVSRRNFLVRSAGTMAALYGFGKFAPPTPAYAQLAPGNPGFSSLLTTAATSRQQLPFWSDVAGWDKPEYYETLQSGHRRLGRRAGSHYTNSAFFNDNRDCLLIRGPRGLLINRFDPTTGQWMQDIDGPELPDSTGWNGPQYYTTIQTADIDGDGSAEILARAGDFMRVYKYSDADQQWKLWSNSLPLSDPGSWGIERFYSTLQCANIDGNGCVLVGRGGGGLLAWRILGSLDGSRDTYEGIAALSAFSDAAGWDKPEYYSTITYGDLVGARAEQVIARAGDKVQVWSLNQDSSPVEGFTELTQGITDGPNWTDANGWNQPQYYETIQTAYLGLWAPDAEVFTVSLVGRGQNGLEVWNLETDLWNQVTFTNPIMTDADGWDKPEYYSTIQFADIDGDGIEELLARGQTGLQAWKVKDNGDSTFTWVPLPNGPAWSDANGWNQVQYYSSIQTATSLQAGDPGYNALQPGVPQSVVVGRNANYVESWSYNPQTQTWSQTSITGFPAFVDSQLAAYNYITTALNIRGTNGGGIRYRYNDETGVIRGWIDDLLGTGIHPVPPPPPNLGVPASDWTAVKTQILNELTWVIDAQTWFGTLTHQQIVDTFLGDQLTLYTVGPYLNYTSTTDTTVLALSILALIAGAAAAVLGFPELEVGEAAAIAGILANTFSAAAAGMAGQGNSYTAQYDQLQSQLSDAFNLALDQLGVQLSSMVGGASGGGYTPGDYGLLSAIGQLIETTIWNWPTDTTTMTATMQRAYATEVWKVLFNAFQVKESPNNCWGIWIYSGKPNTIDDGFPLYAAWFGPEPALPNNGPMNHWLYGSRANNYPMPSLDGLHAQFATPIEGQVFPLGVPTSEFYQGQNGWPLMNTENRGDSFDASPSPFPTAPGPSYQLPSLSANIDTAVKAERDPATGEILVTLTHTNRGLAGAANVEITDIRLGSRPPISYPSNRHKYVGPGRHYAHTFRFGPQTAGSASVVRVSGRYLGGTFGGSFRIAIP